MKKLNFFNKSPKYYPFSFYTHTAHAHTHTHTDAYTHTLSLVSWMLMKKPLMPFLWMYPFNTNEHFFTRKNILLRQQRKNFPFPTIIQN